MSRRSLSSMVALLLLLSFTVGEADAQRRGRRIRRTKIPLVNNASLYTFRNPNFRMPSQLRFAFTAVAHEDCRLFNNGATLMPVHRLLAAQCSLALASIRNGFSNPGMVPPMMPMNPPMMPMNPPMMPYPGGIQPITPLNPTVNVMPPQVAAYYAHRQRLAYLHRLYAGRGRRLPITHQHQGTQTSRVGSRQVERKEYGGFGIAEPRMLAFSSMSKTNPSSSFGYGFIMDTTSQNPSSSED